MRRFKQYSISQFVSFISGAKVNRKITHIQIHHTWRPRKSDYRGEPTIYGMWRYHTQTNGWQDIGQHFSVAPDGTIWDGRSLDVDPAGITGHNRGGIMFEIIGDFDVGQERLEDAQLDAVIQAVRAVMQRFRLTEKEIVFHREHASKTCPGSSISKDWFLKMVREGFQQKEDDEEMQLNSYQWETLADTLAVLAKKGVINEKWAEKARAKQLTQSELAWLNTIMISRMGGV